jgi:putative transposase
VKPIVAPALHQALLGRWEPVYRSRLHYLVTWTTRGRRRVLRRGQSDTLKDLIPRLCEERQIALVDCAVGEDHVHLLFALRPAQSVASAVRELKGRSAIQLLQSHPELRVWLGGNLVWDERYAVETVSSARIERVQQRLRMFHEPQGATVVDPLAEAS